MCKEDGIAALELHCEASADLLGKLDASRSRMEVRWGEKQKRTTREQYALFAARLLHAAGGTFEFTDELRLGFGYLTIWEALAGEYVDPTANPRERSRIADEYAHKAQQGIYALNEVLFQDFEVQVLWVPRSAKEQMIRLITLDADHVVNENGDTAIEVWQQREMARAGGQVKASTRKMARIVGAERAVDAALSGLSRQSLLEDAIQASRSKRRLLVADVPQF